MYFYNNLYACSTFTLSIFAFIIIIFSIQQILATTIARFFHKSAVSAAAEKSLLATLRKKTGYTFANCKKALDVHNNDLNKAEEWLRQQAQALGWSKATKLEGRQTTQGLIGVKVDLNDGVLVEVNCETDFVARNKEFEEIVKETADTCLNFLKENRKAGDTVTKLCLDEEQLKNLKTSDGKKLADKLALMIGTVGENAALKRAMCLTVRNGVCLSGYAHPSGKANDNVLLGRLGGLVAIKSLSCENSEDSKDIGKQLCQHIVGMNPKKIGNPNEEPANNKEDEISLIHQEYLLDDGVTVKEVLEENRVEVVEFKRFECGENLKGVGDQPLEFVETCQ